MRSLLSEQPKIKLAMTEEEEFINFFKIKPELEQKEKSNFIKKHMKVNTTKTTKARTKVAPVTGFKLEDNVPMPELSGKGVKGEFRKTCEIMKKGQSFEAEKVPKNFYQVQKILGIKLVRQKVGNKVRIWRSA